MADQRLTGTLRQDAATIAMFPGTVMTGRLDSYASRCSRGGGYLCTVETAHGPTVTYVAAVADYVPYAPKGVTVTVKTGETFTSSNCGDWLPAK